MPPPSILKNPGKHTVIMERALFLATKERATSQNYSVSEYIGRLLHADLRRKRGVAHLTPRYFPAQEVMPDRARKGQS